MADDSIPALQDAIRDLHGCESKFVESVPVVERLRVGGRHGPEVAEQLVWEGVVSVFDLVGHATATRCYAWSYPLPGLGGTTRKFVAVIHAGPIHSPATAVHASVVSRARDT